MSTRGDQQPPQPGSFALHLKAFGTRVYEARALRRWSQRTLSARSGIARSRISEIESGTYNIGLDSLWKVATGLGLPPAALLDDRNPHPLRPGADPVEPTGSFAEFLAAFAARVTAAREQRDWSKQELANRANMDRPRVSQIESGRENITLEVLWRLARLFGTHPADLLQGRGL